MAITHQVPTRNAIADAVVGRVNLGSAQPTGSIQIATSSAFTTILATLRFANPAFAAATGGQATANAITPDTNAAGTGVAAAFRIIDRDGAEVHRGTVSTPGGGGDMQLSNVNISAGDTVSLSSYVYVAAP